MSAYLTLEKDNDLGIVWLDQQDAKVNKISLGALEAISDVLDEIEQDPSIRAVIFISGKPDTFIAGADLDMIRNATDPDEIRTLTATAHALIRRVRALSKPTIAAIHGAAMGGGLEMTLVCDYRIATNHSKTKLALPEVQLGLLPGGGGTQFLPRLVGLQTALDMMLTGKTVYPRKAKRIGLVDALTYRHNLPDAAKQAARGLLDGSLKPKQEHGLTDRLLESNPVSRRVVYQQAESKVRKQTKGNYPAPFRIIACVKAGLEDGLDTGLAAEATCFADLAFTSESRALVHLFFAKQTADKNPHKEQARKVETVGVLGAGLMGAGIAEVSAKQDLDVLIKDQNLQMAAKGKKHLWHAAQKQVKKRIISPFERDLLMERLTPVAEYEALAPADLVIEAVPENLDLKHTVLAATEAVLREDAIFASNTSSIPIADIADASKHPESVVGMHYFSPVAQMPLLEIIKTEKTSDEALATAYEIGLKQGKTVIVVNDGPGFYTTRILGVYMNEALLLLQEGADIKQVDKAMEQFGFPMGPYELFDLVGIDVTAKITEVMGRYPMNRDMHLSSVAKKLVDAGYLGQKSQQGFYRYEKDDQGRDQKTEANETIYAFFGGSKRTRLDPAVIQQRLALMMVNEAVYCLEENILQSPRDGDLGAVFGLGFPPFLGGPFRYSDTETPPAIAARLSRLQIQHGERFAPSSLLQEHARTGEPFYEREKG